MNNMFDNLIIFEMANNHQGDVNHGIKIIRELGKLKEKYNLNATVKLQYRNLDTFIHPDYVTRTDVNHIPRFLSTKLSFPEFKQLIDEIKAQGMHSMVTPFDEDSVGKCIEHKVDIIKVASCSAKDWPLLEEVSKANKPLILSTGGSSMKDIDALVSFFQHKGSDFGLMHCVGTYPTQNNEINMNFLEKMIHRYPHVPIGWSGHEAPDNIEPVKIAVAKGAKMLERHVGVTTDTISLNAYSMDIPQIDIWLQAIKETNEICGDREKEKINKAEADSLLSLKRGVFAKKTIKKGETIDNSMVLYAMPCLEDQLSSGEFGAYRAEYVASKDYIVNEGIYEKAYAGDNLSIIRNIIHTVKGMLHEAHIFLPEESELEISHHYGIKQVHETGAIIFSIVNREYCKKILVCLPGQTNPMHLHKIKEETFQLLSGDLSIILEDNEKKLKPGEIFLVEPNIMHSFTSTNGAIFEEISSTHRRDDSYYQDEKIAKKDPLERKTIIKDWM